jgi:hypothetical protein
MCPFMDAWFSPGGGCKHPTCFMFSHALYHFLVGFKEAPEEVIVFFCRYTNDGRIYAPVLKKGS